MGKSFFEKRSVFSIRKLAVGACSVLIGVSFFGAPSVLAEEGRAVTEEEMTATREASEVTTGEVVTSDKARNYQDYIDIQCQTYRKTKSRKDWQEVKRLTKEYEEFLANEVDIKRKLLLFGLMKRDQKERQSVYLLLVKKYHLERWV